MKKITDKLVLALVVIMVVTGLLLRFDTKPNNQAFLIETDTEWRLNAFLQEQGYPRSRQVHYTRDAGIRGLQMPLKECDGNLQLSVFSQGDEFVPMWEQRSTNVGYDTAYLYQQQMFEEFPRSKFWLETMLSNLAMKLKLAESRLVEPAIALAYPKSCQMVARIRWNQFSTTN